MKSFKNSIYSLSLLLFLAQTCEKEPKEELNEEQSYLESMYGQKKEAVIADWKKFKATAAKMIKISETDLRTLKFMIESTQVADSRIKWNLVYDKSTYQLADLKRRIDERDLELARELVDYDGSSGRKNADFKKSFLSDIVQIDAELERIIDEEKSGAKDTELLNQ